MHLFKNNLNFAVTSFLLFYVHGTSSQVANSCTTPANAPGRCLPYSMCPVISDVLLNAPKPLPDRITQYIRMSFCGNINGVTQLCCPMSSLPTNTAGTTAATGTSGLNSETCGVSQSDRIANGNKTVLFEHPWMALLAYEGPSELEFLCAGTLISDRFVLTAAHCISGTKSQLVSVRLGEYDLSQTNDCTRIESQRICAPPVEDIDIEYIVVHPQYNKPRFANDIGLIRLAKSVVTEGKSHINTICLPISSASQNQDITRIVAAGWGKTENGTISNILLKATLKVEKIEVCQMLFKRTIQLSAKQMCAKGVGISVDTCKGDSGGPVMYPGRVTNDRVSLIQFGIVSAGGIPCGGEVSFPGIYTKVVPYIDWIINEISNP